MIQPFALVIEDDPTQGSIFIDTLTSIEFQTKLIQDGQEALEFLSTTVPHLVLLDLHLPGADGTQILKYIRTSEHLKDVYVIIASADGPMSDQLPHKANLVLNKPVSVFQLQHLAKHFHPSHNP